MKKTSFCSGNPDLFVFDVNAPRIPAAIEELKNLIELIMKNSAYLSSEDCRSNMSLAGNWGSLLSICHDRYSEVSSLEKRISFLESELTHQTLLFVHAVLILLFNSIGKEAQRSYS